MVKNKFHKLLEVVGFIVVLLLFSLLIIRYYNPFHKDINSDKFVNFDYDALTREAQLISKENESAYSTSVVVLNYHGIDKNTTSGYTISVDEFKEEMFALKREGYETVGIDDLYLFLRGEKQLPEKSFVITFDDAIKTSYYNTDPILKALDYRAIMFVIIGSSLEKNSSYYLNEKELKEMQDSGRWDLQVHTYRGHLREIIDEKNNTGPFYSNKLWLKDEMRIEDNEEYADRVDNDLKMAKEIMEQRFGRSMAGFALPFGDFGQRETNYYGSDQIFINLAQKYYNMVFYQFKPARNKDFRANYNNEKKDFYLVMRISAETLESPDDLIETMNAAQSLSLPYVENFDSKKRWIAVWGTSLVQNDYIALRNEAGNSGSMAYLDGSYLWKDYSFSAHIQEAGARKIMLTARFQDSENYAACRFENGSVSIINVREKIKKVVYEKKYFYQLKDDMTLSINVFGTDVSCFIDGERVIEGSVLHIPLNGGIAVRTEEFLEGKQLLFDNIQVNENKIESLSAVTAKSFV